MTRHLEDGRSIYVGYLNQFGFNEGIVRHFFDIRNECGNELIGMKQLVDRIKPVPAYRVYGGAISLPKDEYLYHSAISSTLAETLLKMHEQNDRFSIDGNSQIVLAGSNVIVPRVKTYTPVIITRDVYRLPKNHAGIKLFSLAEELEDKVVNAPGSYEFVMLLLGEGFNDNMDNIVRAIFKTSNGE